MMNSTSTLTLFKVDRPIHTVVVTKNQIEISQKQQILQYLFVPPVLLCSFYWSPFLSGITPPPSIHSFLPTMRCNSSCTHTYSFKRKVGSITDS